MMKTGREGETETSNVGNGQAEADSAGPYQTHALYIRPVRTRYLVVVRNACACAVQGKCKARQGKYKKWGRHASRGAPPAFLPHLHLHLHLHLHIHLHQPSRGSSSSSGIIISCMAAPSIPNLLRLQPGGGRGGPGGRGRRPGGPAASPARTAVSAVSPDAAVQATDTDAAVSRLSAVDLGYLDDAYARLFVTGPPTRRLPIINRGERL